MTLKESWFQIRIRKELRDRFLETAHREGRSASEIARELIEDYLRKHEYGNPQRPLPPFLERRVPPYESPTCSFCLKPATFICYLKEKLDDIGRKVYACEVHRNLLRNFTPYYGERNL